MVPVSDNVFGHSKSVLQVIVSWGDRVLKSYRFKNFKEITVGSSKKSDIQVPIFAGRSNYKLIENNVSMFILLNHSMEFFDEKSNSAITFYNGKFSLTGGESLKILIGGGIITLTICFVDSVKKPVLQPIVELNSNETIMFGLSLILCLVISAYLNIINFAKLKEKAPTEKVFRKAKIIFSKIETKRTEKVKLQVVSKDYFKKPIKIRKTKKKNPKTVSKKDSIKSLLDSSTIRSLSVFGSGANNLIDIANKSNARVGYGNIKNDERYKTKNIAVGVQNMIRVGGQEEQLQNRVGKNFGADKVGGNIAKTAVGINLQVLEPEISGVIDKEAIRRVIRSHKKSIQHCYVKGLNRNKDLYGKTVLSWIIGESGAVQKVNVVESSLSGKSGKIVENCIMAKVRNLNFPHLPSGQIAEVKYPFVFVSE